MLRQNLYQTDIVKGYNIGKRPLFLWCVVFGLFSVLAIVRGLRTSVDVGAAAPGAFCFECCHFLLGQECRRLVWCVASGPVCGVWVVRFSPVSLINWTNFSLLNEKAKLLLVAPKKYVGLYIIM